VVLFSSLESDEDRRRGASSGANAYLTESAFDRGQLLDVVARFLQGL
jgi:two-component system chemotaxis sensor kinase CheA